jgi:hypothetical protein
MTKTKVISEVLTAVRKALEAKLTHDKYSEYLKGSLSFRLDLIPAPDKVVRYLKLDGTAKPLEIRFTRPYTRRRALPVEVSDADKK